MNRQAVRPPGPIANSAGSPGPVQRFFVLLYPLTMALAIAGYPVSGLATTIILPGESTINIGFRLMVIGLSAIVAAHSLFVSRRITFPLLVAVYFVLYGLRLYFDTFISYVEDADLAGAYLLATVMAPMIAAAFGAWQYDDRRFAWCMLVVAGTATLGILLIDALGLDAGLLELTEETGRLGFDALNPITVGYTGLYTAIAAFALWPHVSPGTRLVLMTLSLLGGYVLILAASRGPLVSAVLCLAFIAGVRRKIFLGSVALVACVYAAIFLADSDLSIAERFQGIGTDMSSSERLFVLQNSIDQAIAHPMFGHAYVETITLSYPHNLLIESALAIGVAGLISMIFIQVRILLASWRLGRHQIMCLSMLSLSGLMNAQLSSAIWGATDFWIAGVTCLLIGARLRRATRRAPSRSSMLASHGSNVAVPLVHRPFYRAAPDTSLPVGPEGGN